MKISIVIPVYNEKGRLESILGKVQKYDEVIVVDDASELPVLSHIKKNEYPKTIFFRNTLNSGNIYSIKKGIKKAYGDIIVTIDADGENKPEDIDKLILPIIDDKCDIVYGRRPYIPRFSELLLLRLANIFTGEKIKDAGTGFRAIRACYAKQLQFKGKCTCGMLHLEAHQKGMRSCEVKVDLPSINKPRRIMWEHIPQFFILISNYLLYRLFDKKI